MSTPATTAMPFQGGAASTPPATTSEQAHAREMQNAARELREAIRNNVDQKLIQAQAQEAAAAALAQTRVFQVTPPTPPEAPRPVIIRRPNGETFTISPGAFNNVIPPQVVDISIAFFVTLAVIIIGLPIARAFARRMDRRSAGGQMSSDMGAQIAQLNQAVDAIAVEVERISEGQRYTTRLLTEQREASHQTLPSAVNR
ncbi:MAG: hypothetical protein ACJ79J_00845 [Gemmatimonadaceae bacterium]